VVVLDDADEGQLVEAGEVHRLVPGALVGGAVAAEEDADGAVALVLGGEGGAHGDGGAAGDDAVGAEDAEVEVGDVHRAALAVAVAGGAAVKLGEHAAHVAALGDAVAVAAVGAGDGVGRLQLGADAGGDRLLADIEVNGAGDLRLLGQAAGRLLELADLDHRPEHVEQQLGVEVHPSVLLRGLVKATPFVCRDQTCAA